MEISNRLPPQYAPQPQAPSRAAEQATEQFATATREQQTNNESNNGVTTYVNQGDVLQGRGNTDYRDLIREARQQQVPPNQQRDIPAGGQTPAATRAVEAYQSGGETQTAAAQRQSFNRIV